MKRKWFGMMIALALCLGLCPIGVFATEGEPDGANVPAPIDEPAVGNVAQVEKGGDVIRYDTIEAAWAAALEAKEATVTLLANASVTGSLSVPVGTNIILTCADGSNYTLSAAGSETTPIGVNGGTLYVKSGTVSGSRCGIMVQSGTLVMEGGTLAGSESGLSVAGGTVNFLSGTASCTGTGSSTAGISITQGKLDVRGGTISSTGNYGLYVLGGSIALYGGSFSGSQLAIYIHNSVSSNLSSLLASSVEGGDRYAYYSGDDPLTGILDKKLIQQPVEVRKCEHKTNTYYTKNDEKHTRICASCGDSSEEPHTSDSAWISAFDSHYKCCTLCTGVYSKATHSFDTDTTPRTCTVCQFVQSGKVKVVAADGTTTYHDGLYEAGVTAKASPGSVVTLLADVYTSSYWGPDSSGHNFTLTSETNADGNVCSVNFSGQGLSVENGNLTIQEGSFKISSTTSPLLNVSGGTVTIYGGHFQSGLTHAVDVTGNGTAIIHGGYFWGKNGLYVSGSSNVKIKAGTFRGSPSSSYAICIADDTNTTLGDLLDNSDGTWRAYYDSKGVIIAGKLGEKKLTGTVTVRPCTAHSFTEAGHCTYCGAPAEASVDIDGATSFYGTVTEAWTAAQGKTATVTLFRSVDLGSGFLRLDNAASDITLEMADGVTLSNNATGYPVITVAEGTLTVNGGTIKGTGDASHGIKMDGNTAVLNITGGSIMGKTSGLWRNLGTVHLSGGSFTATASASNMSSIQTTSGTLADLLADGYAYKLNGSWMSVADRETNGRQLRGTVTVVPAPVKITAQPESASIFFGNTHTLSVATEPTDAVSYQWYQDGSAISGATGADYAAGGLEAGEYQFYCLVSCGGYQVKSAAATVTVTNCTHPGSQLTDNGDGTHGGTCPYCGTEIAAAPHTLGADNKCEGCKTPLVASVKIGEDTTYYGGIEKAWTAATAEGVTSAEITLLDNVTRDAYWLVSAGRKITLNGGNYTLSVTGITVSGGQLDISNGTFKFAAALMVSGGTVRLSGGEFINTNGQEAISCTPGSNLTVGDFLLNYGSTNAAEKHYAYYQNGQPIEMTGQTSLSGTVKVDECKHDTSVREYRHNDGTQTHTLTCLACGYTEGAEDCSYGTEYQHDDTNHWQTCTACGYENKVGHSWEFDFASSGNVIENCWVCLTCLRTKDHRTLRITVPDGLTYGNTGGKQVTYTVSPETTCDKVTWRFTGGGPEFAGGVLPANLSVGEHWFRVEGLMSDDTIVFSGSYYITVAPKPLTVTGVTAAGRDYDGTNEVAITAVALDGVVAGDTVSVDTTGLKGTIPGPNAGAYTSVTLPKTMKLTGAAAGNYTLTQPTGALAASVTIGKADYTGAKAANTSAKFGAAAAYDLTGLLPAGATAGTPTTSGDIFDGTPGVSGKTLTYALKADAAVGGTGAITVPVTSTNYKDFNLTITVTAADKDVPALTVSPITVTYSGEAVPDSAIKGAAKAGDTTVPGAWSFAPGQSLANVADSGAKTVIFKPTDTAKYAEATGTAAVTINKATPSGTPTYTAISTGGKTLADAALTAPAGWPAGTLTWELPGTTEVAANTAYRWTFTPDNANYNTLSGSITLWQRSTGGGSGSGGSSGGSGGSGSAALPVTTTGQNSSYLTTTTTAVPTASTSGGRATAAVDTAMGNEIVAQAVANKSETVVIAPKVTGSVTRTEVSIPAATVGQIGTQTRASLTVSTPVADVTIPNGGLYSLSSAGGTVIVSAKQTGSTVELSVTAGGKAVDNVPGGLTLTVPVSYTTPGTVAVLVHDNGMREVVRKSVADNGSVTIPLDGSAKLEIVDNSKYFYDVPAVSWAADAAAFASAHELFNGTAPNQFSPDLPMSRGMLATVLHNLESNPYQPITGVFADVNSGTWYAEGVAWAAANGIVTGYGSGQFGPNDNITREQLAVMLWRYAGSPAAANRELRFADAYRASGWALEALRWATQNGIINGKGGGILDPTGQATRAETAQMLKNFMERR